MSLEQTDDLLAVLLANKRNYGQIGKNKALLQTVIIERAKAPQNKIL